jgi:hypothetical protein
VINTGMISPSWSFAEVLALNALQNSMMLTPCGPSAVPTGGAGVALSAGICSFTEARVDFRCHLGNNESLNTEQFRMFGSRLAKTVVRAFRRHISSPSIPYVATFTVSAGFRLSPDFAVKRYPGLKVCHIVRGPAGSDKLFAYWDDQRHFDLHKAGFAGDNCLPSPETAGAIADLHLPRESFLRWLVSKDWILGAAALVAAVTLLHGSVASLVDPPDAQVTFGDLAPIDVASGQPINVPVSVLNQSAYAPARILNVESQANSGDRARPIPLIPDLSNVPLIAAGQTTKVQVSGTAPVVADHLPRQDYEIGVAVTVRTGYLRGRGVARPPAPLRLFVWPGDVGWGIFGRVGQATSASLCRFTVDLYTGRPYEKGWDGQVKVKSLPTEVTHLRFNEELKTEELPVSPPNKNGEVTRVVYFHTPALEKFKAYKFAVTLESPVQLAPGRWEQLRPELTQK